MAESLKLTFNKNYQAPEIQLLFEPPVSIQARPKISSSQDAEKIFRECWPKGKIGLQEHFYLMMLNRSNTVLGVAQIGVGGIDFAPVDLTLVFSAAVKSCSSGLIFAHNHPSGNLRPSEADISLTKKLIAAAKIFDMQVPDHIILSPWDYYSMADENILPEVGNLSRWIEILQPESR